MKVVVAQIQILKLSERLVKLSIHELKRSREGIVAEIQDLQHGLRVPHQRDLLGLRKETQRKRKEDDVFRQEFTLLGKITRSP